MITIRELPAIDVPSKTSLFINFDFNREIIDLLKTFDISKYNKKTNTWEVPLDYLHIILNNLCYIDSIDLYLLEDSHEKSSVYYPILNYKTNPMDHQLEAIRYGLNKDKWLLLDAPGLGKTLSITYLAEELRAQKGLEHCLIICAINTLKPNWESEIHKHSDLSCRILGKHVTKTGNIDYGSISDRANELVNPINEFFIITNIESFRNKDMQEALRNSHNKIDMVVIDEVHKCKDSQSIQGQALLGIKAKYKIAATGTLLMNSPLDAYVPLQFVDYYNKDRLLTRFKEYFTIQGGMSGYQILGYKRLNILKDQIESVSLRRTKDLLNLPPKTIIPEIIDMEDSHKDLYNKVKQAVKDESFKIELNSTNLLSLVTRLRQVTACPSIITTDKIVHTKLERAKELVEEIVSNNEKVCIFSTFKDSVYVLADMLKEYNPLIATGDQKDQEIEYVKNTFQEDPNYKVFIGTWQKMGTGITLTSASYMICIDTAWTAAAQEQTEDRIYRIGTEKPVFIYRLICKDTIDERVQQLLEDKQALSDYVVDNIITDKSLDSLRKYIQDL